MTLEHKEDIVRWIVDNPGYVYSKFTFLPEHDGEVLPTTEEFEALTHNVNDWVEVENAELDEHEQEMYPGTVHRYKYIFQPLNNGLYVHVFVDTDNKIQYIVVLA